MLTAKFQYLVSLGLVLSAIAYQITAPSDLASSGAPWTGTGPNAIRWERVSTDPDSFSIVLVNEDRSLMPVNNQFLASAVDGTLLSIAVSPASGQNFPVGSGFRVNFIKRIDSSTIYAQSSQFRITSDGSTSTPLSNMSSTVSGGSFASTETQMPHTTYVAPAQTQTVTTIIGSAHISFSPDRALVALVCGGALVLLLLCGTFI